jgi:hypothetical protein
MRIRITVAKCKGEIIPLSGLINKVINLLFIPVSRVSVSDSDSGEGWTIRATEPAPTRRYTIPRRAPEGGSSTWDLALAVWPLEDRPDAMRDPSVVNGMNLQTLFAFKEHYEILQKKEGKGETAFGSDRKLPTKHFPDQEDDATDKLHAVRFERGPVVEPGEYWDKMPLKRCPTFRHIALEHAGLAHQVNECVITRAHDRTLPLRLRMFARGNHSRKGFVSKDGEGKEPADSWDQPR